MNYISAGSDQLAGGQSVISPGARQQRAPSIHKMVCSGRNKRERGKNPLFFTTLPRLKCIWVAPVTHCYSVFLVPWRNSSVGNSNHSWTGNNSYFPVKLGELFSLLLFLRPFPCWIIVPLVLKDQLCWCKPELTANSCEGMVVSGKPEGCLF